VGGALLVVGGVFFFAREVSVLSRIIAALVVAWGVLLTSIPMLPQFRRRFEVVVDDAGIHATTGLVRWTDLEDIAVGTISGRSAVLLQTGPGAAPGQAHRRSSSGGTYLPYTLPGSPTALEGWLNDEWRARRRARPPS
jgi:hypothetical protein